MEIEGNTLSTNYGVKPYPNQLITTVCLYLSADYQLTLGGQSTYICIYVERTFIVTG